MDIRKNLKICIPNKKGFENDDYNKVSRDCKK